MLIRLRSNDGKLIVKDILDIDFNMFVDENKDSTGKRYYTVQVNNKFTYDEKFDSEEAAEVALNQIAEQRNALELELRGF